MATPSRSSSSPFRRARAARLGMRPAVSSTNTPLAASLAHNRAWSNLVLGARLHAHVSSRLRADVLPLPPLHPRGGRGEDPRAPVEFSQHHARVIRWNR